MTELTIPRINRLLETAIYVDDLELAAQFYDRVFGLEPLLRDQRVVAYDAGSSTVLLLFRRGVSMTGQSLPGGFIPAHDGSGPVHFSAAKAPPVMGMPPVGTTIGTWNVVPVGTVATGITGNARPPLRIDVEM